MMENNYSITKNSYAITEKRLKAKTPLFQALLSAAFPLQQVVTENRPEAEINYCCVDSTNTTRFRIG